MFGTWIGSLVLLHPVVVLVGGQHRPPEMNLSPLPSISLRPVMVRITPAVELPILSSPYRLRLLSPTVVLTPWSLVYRTRSRVPLRRVTSLIRLMIVRLSAIPGR